MGTDLACGVLAHVGFVCGLSVSLLQATQDMFLLSVSGNNVTFLQKETDPNLGPKCNCKSPRLGS